MPDFDHIYFNISNQEAPVQLKLKRSQRETGTFTKTTVFCLDAQAEYTAAERESINRYKLGGQNIYNSQAARKHYDAAKEAGASGTASGLLKGVASMAMASFQLNISIDSLGRGTHVECKDLNELMDAEEAIMTACQNVKAFLSTAGTFDGREMLFDFDAHGEPKMVAPA